MPELEARGPEPEQVWRRTLTNGPFSLGRTKESDWDVTWDTQISRKHALLTWTTGRLQVKRVPGAKNQVFYQGLPLDEFELGMGEKFVIGRTTFTLLDDSSSPGTDHPVPISELTCSHLELQKIRFVDANDRIEALVELPGMIRFMPSEQDVETRVVQVLLKGIPRADMAGVVWINPASSGSNPEVRVRALANRPATSGELTPSRRLVFEAVRRRRQAVMHSWASRQDKSAFTLGGDADWAICAPLPDEPSPGFAVYVTGRNYATLRVRDGTDTADVEKSDLKFATLVAEIFGSLRQVRDLQRRQTLLSQVFSPRVLAAIAEKNIEEVLRERQTEVTVLFCDLRGSCKIAEEGEQDLASLWKRMSEALTIMTTNIVDKEGVIGDFQGDAAMGFWGWPRDGGEDQIERAARAALAIRRQFARAALQPGDPLHGFACGLGIAHGAAIAGKLGTADQLKIGVFGPVVNLAARLESMTKFFQVPILIDEATAEHIAASGGLGRWARVRRLARIRPMGMSKDLMVSELLPLAVEFGAMREQDRGDYEAALDAFIAGQWSQCRNLLGRLPEDGGRRFLEAFMTKHKDKPPAGWDGTIAMEAK